MGDVFDFSTGARIASARPAPQSQPATNVVPITTDPIARARALLAQSGETLDRSRARLEALVGLLKP